VRTLDPRKTHRIIDAAAQLFAERHYHEVRMEDIAAKADVAKGTLYLHFKDKEALYLGLILDGAERICQRIEQSFRGVTCPEEKTVCFVRESIRFLEERPYFLELILHAEAVQSDQRSTSLRQHNPRLLEIVHDLVAGFPALRQASPLDQELAVLALLGQTKEILRLLPRPWPDDLPERIAGQFIHGIGPTPPGSSRSPRDSLPPSS
jgi:TetR/AcrR family transcriptional regulator